MKIINWLAATIVSVAGIAFLAAFILPLPQGVPPSQLAHLMAMLILYLGGAALFLLALRGFRRRLKIAYSFICITMVLLAISMSQYAIQAAFNLYDAWWFQSYAYILPLVIALVLTYAGVRIIAKVVGVTSILTRSWVVLVSGLIFGGIWGFMRYLSTAPHLAKEYDYTLIPDGFMLGVSIVIMVLVYQAGNIAGLIYRPALRWLFWWQVAAFFGLVYASLSYLYLPTDHWSYALYLHFTPAIVVGLTVVLAAWHFNRIRFVEQNLSNFVEPKAKGRASSVDVVLSLATLASNPKDIDPILDDMRVITSQQKANNAPIGKAEQKKLGEVYLKIENYLAERDPARKYEVSALREMIETRFKGDVNESVFWETIERA